MGWLPWRLSCNFPLLLFFKFFKKMFLYFSKITTLLWNKQAWFCSLQPIWDSHSTSGPAMGGEGGKAGLHFMQSFVSDPPRGNVLCNISLIYCLLGYSRIYIEKKSALNINPACWTCTVIISILYFHLFLYIKSMCWSAFLHRFVWGGGGGIE